MATVTINFSGFPGPGPTGVSFTVAAGSVAAFLNANPTVPISLSATVAADNLTSLGLLSAGGDTVWRITNEGVEDNAATLVRVGGVFSASPVLPANSFTFLRGGAPGTYKLTTSSPADTFTKASGPQIVSAIQALAINDSYDITGSNFNDTLVGGQNADTLRGGLGNDSLNGQQQNDLVDGGAGDDTLIGGGQNDTLIGGAGSDTLSGGSGTGADRFQYNFSNEGTDSITDFGIGLDAIVVSNGGFGGGLNTVSGGTLDPLQFGATAGGAVRFVYSGGVLQFDTDAGPGISLVTIANIAGPGAGTLGAGNILVVA
ncbi:MAG: calcium-binding protein [bacterium]|jgi:serralysin